MSVVLAIGNPFDGTTIVGPFGSGDEAADYAEKFSCDETWHIVPIEEPDPAFDNWDELPDDHLYRDGDNPAVEEVLEVDDNDDNPAVVAHMSGFTDTRNLQGRVSSLGGVIGALRSLALDLPRREDLIPERLADVLHELHKCCDLVGVEFSELERMISWTDNEFCQCGNPAGVNR